MAVTVAAAVSSGERLRTVLDAAGLSAHRFAGYWAGFPAGEPIRKDEVSERGRRFRAYKRSLHRIGRDEQTPGEQRAVEIVATANRLIVERGGEPFPADFLVTPEETRLAGIEELRLMLREALERLARIEERLP